MNNSDKVQAMDVIRDENGWFYHDQLPEFDTEYIPGSWFSDRGLELSLVNMDGDVSGDVMDSWFENGDCDCSSWNPSMPDGDGWFVFGIWDTEDGPICAWVRNKG